MNAEQLQDAISLLPEEMVADVDRLRRKKPVARATGTRSASKVKPPTSFLNAVQT